MKTDIYAQLNQLIKELRLSEKTRLAEILDHRIHKVAWTTSSELFKEIRNIFNKELKTNENQLSENLKNLISDLLKNAPS